MNLPTDQKGVGLISGMKVEIFKLCESLYAHLTLESIESTRRPQAILEIIVGFLTSKPSVGTRKEYLRALIKYLSFLEAVFPKIELSQIRPFHIEIYRDSLVEVEISGEKRSNNTIRFYLSSVSSFYSYLIREGVLRNNPCDVVTFPKRENKRGTLSLSQESVKKIIDYLENLPLTPIALRNRAMILVYLTTGVRKSAVVKLRRKDFYNHQGNYYIKFEEKGERPQKKKVLSWVGRSIEEYIELSEIEDIKIEKGGFLFRPLKNTVNKNKNYNRQINERYINEILKKISIKAGVGEYSNVHGLRKTFALALRRSGADLETIQKELNHRDPKTTFDYLRTECDDYELGSYSEKIFERPTFSN